MHARPWRSAQQPWGLERTDPSDFSPQLSSTGLIRFLDRGTLRPALLVDHSPLLLERTRQVRNRIAPQIIHDTRSQGFPRIVQRTRHVIGTLGKTAGALLVFRQAVQCL